MEPINVVEHKGFKIEVHQDDCNDNDPREWDNLGTMTCFHKHYNLGDKHDLKSGHYNGWAELLAAIEERDGPLVYLPLYLFDHSGLSMRTGTREFRACDSAGWDWGQVGFIHVSHAKIKKETKWKKFSARRLKKIEDILQAEVKTYNDVLQGNVYGYIVKTPDGAHLDSCFGYFGQPEESGLLDDARAAINRHLAERKEVANGVGMEPHC